MQQCRPVCLSVTQSQTRVGLCMHSSGKRRRRREENCLQRGKAKATAREKSSCLGSKERKSDLLGYGAPAMQILFLKQNQNFTFLFSIPAHELFSFSKAWWKHANVDKKCGDFCDTFTFIQNEMHF